MPSYERDIPCEVHAGLGLQDAHDRKRHGHESGLGIFRKGELLGRPLPDDPGELLIESRIDLRKYLSCRRKGLRERLAHPDALTSLTGKHERSGHSS